MDIVTHGLASLAVARGFFPRAGKAATVAAIIAGTIADIDWASSYFGPSVFLTWHGAYTHSIFAAALVSILLLAIPLLAVFRAPAGIAPTVAEAEAVRQTTKATRNFSLRVFFLVAFAAPLSAALLHVAMDACQSDGVMLFWPFSSRRVALDWLPDLDPWILIILIGAIAIPELLRLVVSEIGAKSKKPRGQTGALIGLALVLIYAGTRATLHSNVIALLGSRTFHGEASRRAWAFPEPLSLLVWHGVVETESALDRIRVNAASSRDFDPDLSLRIFKPESSPALAAARNTAVAKRFLAAARIPKASVEKIQAGYVVILRDLRYSASGESKHEIAAYFELDRNNQVTTQELVWARDLRQ